MARSNSADTARRLISLLGHFADEGRIPLEVLAKRAGVSTAQLTDDLSTLSVCGVAPYFPDMMVDVFVEDDMVEIYSPMPAIPGSVRLSAAEAEALVAALSATGFSADAPLTKRLLTAASSGFDADALAHTLRAETTPHDSGVFETIAGAIASREALTITYQRDGAAAPGQRTIEPHRLVADRGAWYVSAHCRSAGEERTFRVDRVRTAVPTGEHFEYVHTESDSPVFTGSGLPTARLRFAPGEPFVERDWPGGVVVEIAADSATIADVPYGGTGWIARAVVARLGAVTVLEPSEVRDAVRSLAVERLAEL